MTTEAPMRRKKALGLLGLPESAGPALARRAFRRLAFEGHPDLHGGDEAKTHRFRNLLEAYRTVCATLAPPPGHTQTSPPAPSQGRDLHFRLRLDFLQAALGGEVCLRYARESACPACKGTDLDKLLSHSSISSDGIRQRSLGLARQKSKKVQRDKAHAEHEAFHHHHH